MKKETVLTAVILLLIGGVGGYVAAKRGATHEQCGYQTEETATAIPPGMHRMPDGTLMGNTDNVDDDTMGTMNQADHMMAMMVESERAFIEGMIPHHQEAVDTAKEVIERGGSTPEVAQLVKDIVVAQEREITQMKEWYENWYGVTYTDTGTYMPMMRELENLSGAEIDRVFLEDMIRHHMGAIMMAQSVQPHIEHDEIAELTEAIVLTQSAEIASMRKMLESL